MDKDVALTSMLAVGNRLSHICGNAVLCKCAVSYFLRIIVYKPTDTSLAE